ncbi:unnamed protein product [Ectocarpus sp. CCAP 1310/34]|nr:unnamed protein product [Ectocarpus sp. CCAP 1310/34]
MRGDVNEGTGGGGGGGGRADRIDVEVSRILLSRRNGRAGEGSGASSLTELDDLMSTWSTSAPAVFPSLVSPAPEGDATAELLEAMSGALEEGGGNPCGISAEMLHLCSGTILHCKPASSSTACPAAATSSSCEKASTVAFPDGDQTLLDWKSLLA